MPKWMATVDPFRAAKAGGLGVVFSEVIPKNLALTIAAIAGVTQAGLGAGKDVVAIAVFVVIGSLTVVGPVVADLVMGRKAEHAPTSIKDGMAAHNAAIMFVLFLVLGATLLGDRIGGL